VQRSLLLAALLVFLLGAPSLPDTITAAYPGAFQALYGYMVPGGVMAGGASLFTGGAVHASPIEAVPTPGGMTPSLPRIYNSRNAGGNAGKGW
jgi:hypothetical protein